MTFGKFRKALRVTKQRLTWPDLRQNLALRPTRKSGGAEYVPTAYYAHRDAAGFASRETGNERKETI
jgi:hypothetical protein